MYITDLSNISCQDTYKKNTQKIEYEVYNDLYYKVIEPDYSEVIPKSLLRRMGRMMKIGTAVGLDLISKHDDLDGILIGTGGGGLEDCFKFLSQIVEYNEGRLTPTNFVQSTPNAVSSQIAMMSETRNYNVTYTNGGHSFEDTILDAILLLNEEKKKLLIGGMEEMSDCNYKIDRLNGIYKSEPMLNSKLLEAKSPGSIFGESCAMFVVEKEAENYLAQILDVHTFTFPQLKDVELILAEFLLKNEVKISQIDNLIVGKNGDIRHNSYYDKICHKLSQASQFSFKNYFGESNIASTGAVWLACQILTKKELPKNLILKSVKNSNNFTLIYNHFNEIEHSFILLSK